MGILKWIGRGLVALLALAAIAYPVSDILREPLDDAARGALIKSGKAQRFVKLAAGVTHVRVEGPANGPAIVLIHGFSVGGFIYDDWIGPLTAAGYRVIVPDMYGHGYSERIAGPHTKEIYVEQVAGLLDALQVSGPVHIVGSSMGGSVTTSFAARYPARVKSVTLIAPAGLQEAKTEGRWASAPVIGDWLVRVAGPALLEYGFAQAASRTTDPDAVLEKFRERARFRGHAEGLLDLVRHYDLLSQTADYDALGRSGLPVLAVWGTADQVIPFTQSEALRRRVPQAVVAPLKDMPHGTPIIAPEGTMAPIMPFLAKAEGQ
ncbi:MAG: alpha/beta fold hydrolase [Micropepsaceae bacterium]